MYLIVGLGNPTAKYEKTRHNAGFDVIDAIADKYGIELNLRKGKAFCGTGYIEGQKVMLAKPQTYMNLSGDSVSALVNFYKLNPMEDLIVVFDDISLARAICGSGKKEVRADTTVSKILLQKPGRISLHGLKSAWGKNRQAGIWQIMCWDGFRWRTEKNLTMP